MKKILILLPVFFIFLSINAQKAKEFDIEKIKSQKVAFLTEKMDLTVKEAQVFWPVYNECQKKLDVLFSEEYKIFKSLKTEDLKEKEITSLTDRLYDIRAEKMQINREYYEKYKSILSAKKLSALIIAEKGFKKHLIQKTKGKK